MNDQFDSDAWLDRQCQLHEQWLEEQFQRLELDEAFEELTTTTTTNRKQ